MPESFHPDSDCARILRYREQVLASLLADKPQQQAVRAEQDLSDQMSDVSRAARAKLLQALTTEEGLKDLQRYRMHEALHHFDLIADEAYRIALANGENPQTLTDPVTLRIALEDKEGLLSIEEMKTRITPLLQPGCSLPHGIIRDRNLLTSREIILHDDATGYPLRWRHGDSLVFIQQLGEAQIAQSIGKPFDDLILLPMLNGLNLTVIAITPLVQGRATIRIETDAKCRLEELAV